MPGLTVILVVSFSGDFDVIKIESLKPIETFTAAEAGKDDGGKAIEAFMKQIKKALNSI